MVDRIEVGRVPIPGTHWLSFRMIKEMEQRTRTRNTFGGAPEESLEMTSKPSIALDQ